MSYSPMNRRENILDSYGGLSRLRPRQPRIPHHQRGSMPLGIPRVRLILFGALAILLIAGIGLLAVDAKQVICQPDVYSSDWFFNFLRRDLRNFGPPVTPPYIYFNYGVAHMSSSQLGDNFVSGLQAGTPLSTQIAWTDSRFAPCCCTYSVDASSGIMLRRNGEPSPPAPSNAGNIVLSALIS